MSTPEAFFRETIDLNRYSNAVAKDFQKAYNDVILTAAKKLKQINIRQAEAGAGVVVAPQTRKRLRAIIQQSKISLDTWSRTTTKQMIKEIEGLAEVQAGFIENELKKVVKSGNVPINSVAVSKKYAESFVKTDPTQTNIFTNKEFTEDDFKKFGSGKFELTARQGAMQTLPNGQTVEKAFRGIAERQKDALARHIRQGVFSGESTAEIARRMVGRLEFGQKGSVRQIAAAGGELTKLANYQVQTIVRIVKLPLNMNMLQRWTVELALFVEGLTDRSLHTIKAQHHHNILIVDLLLFLLLTLMDCKRNIQAWKSHQQAKLLHDLQEKELVEYRREQLMAIGY